MIESARTWLLLRSLRRGSHAPPDQIERRRARLVGSALAHARENVPLYRRLWRGLPLELERLPVVTGAQVREAFASGELPAEGASDEYQVRRLPGGGGELRAAPGVNDAHGLAAGLSELLGGARVEVAPGFDPAGLKTRVIV